MQKNYKEFFCSVLIELINNNVNVKFINKIQRNEEIEIAGSFSGNRKELILRIDKPQKRWILNFAHEYNHFIQWKEKHPDFIKSESYSFPNIDEWLAYSVEYTKKELKHLQCVIQNVELDCEKRTVETFKKWNMPVDLNYYIKSANSYIMFYDICFRYRQWYQTAPYLFPEIYEKLPNKWLDKNQYYKTPKWFEKLVLKYCF